MFALDAYGFGRSEPHAANLRCYAQSVDYFADDIYTLFEVVSSASACIILYTVALGTQDVCAHTAEALPG